MKLLIQGFCMADSMFCAIPSPFRKIWNEDARAHMTLCLPLVGLKLGLLWALLGWLLNLLKVPQTVFAALMAAYPHLVTGYIHLDGFMDVTDAIKSCRDLQRRQEILKDSHVGAFSVIAFGLLILLEFALFLQDTKPIQMLTVILIPVVSRCCSALSIHVLRPLSSSQYAGTRKQGIRRNHVLVLSVILIMALAGAGFYSWKSLLSILAVLAGYGLALMRAVRSLGGMSGDISGYALTIAELCGIFAAVLI